MKGRMANLLAAIAVGAIGMFGPGCQRDSNAATVVEANIGIQATANLPVAAVPAPAVAAPAMNGDIEVLTQGPVHEAFAEPTSYDLTPGEVIPREPPAAIEEIPPDERPEGNPIWIPGYWQWDTDRADFIWISGIWRIPPPDCDWVPGYWSAVNGGWSWTPGFWMTDTTQEVNYLPTPPESLEVGPSSPAPAENYVWTPGCWIWLDGRYAWRPGYWLEARADWVWVPPTYVYTSSGCIYVDGYWDYAVADRGVIFAPVYYRNRAYARPAYVYTPSIVIEVNYITTCLFISPRHHHYYFGDYYGDTYYRRGYVPWFDYRRNHHGYDPIYTHERWRHHRDNPRWESDLRDEHRRRETHADARPPRVYRRGDHDRGDYRMAAPLNEYSKRTDSRMRFQKVSDEQRRFMSDHGREVTKFRNERARVESKRSKGDQTKTALVVPREIRQIRHSNGDMPKRPDEGRKDRGERQGRNADVRSDRDRNVRDSGDMRAPRTDQRRDDAREIRTPDTDKRDARDVRKDEKAEKKDEKRIDQAERRDSRRSRMPIDSIGDNNRDEAASASDQIKTRTPDDREARKDRDVRERDAREPRTETQDVNKRDESSQERIDIKPIRTPKPVTEIQSGRTQRGRSDSGKPAEIPDFKPTRNSRSDRSDASREDVTRASGRTSDRGSISTRGSESRRDDTPRVSTDRSTSDRGVNPPRSESRREETPRVNVDRGSSDRGSSSRSEAPKVESPKPREDSSSKRSSDSSSSSSSSDKDKKDHDSDRGGGRSRH